MGVLIECLCKYDIKSRQHVLCRADEDVTANDASSRKEIITKMLVIPTISSDTVRNYRETLGNVSIDISESVMKDFQERNGYELWYKFEKSSFATVSLINAFLVQLYIRKEWKFNLLRDADIFKEKLEDRRPGVVSLIKFSQDLVIIEEENLDRHHFYTNRIIRIFTTDQIVKEFNLEDIEDVDEMFTDSMYEAKKKIQMIARKAIITFTHNVSNINYKKRQ